MASSIASSHSGSRYRVVRVATIRGRLPEWSVGWACGTSVQEPLLMHGWYQWERMSQSESSGGLRGAISTDFMSTHPANSKRIKQLNEWMHEVSIAVRLEDRNRFKEKT